MEFIDKLKEVGCETYKYTAEKTSRIAKETKLKMKMSQKKSDIEDIYEEIGKAIYQEHIREEKTDIKEQIEEFCTKIDVLSSEIDDIRTEILNLKDKKKCSVCAKEMDIEDKFCPSCGKEQPTVKIENAEVVTEENREDKEIKTPEFVENTDEQEDFAREENEETEENEDDSDETNEDNINE